MGDEDDETTARQRFQPVNEQFAPRADDARSLEWRGELSTLHAILTNVQHPGAP